jgi:uracil-DNA glycosylase
MRTIKPVSRAALLAAFSQRAAKCSLCGLCRTRRSIVIGRGVIPAQVLFIGEGPGQSEDLIGKPFVGASGKLLDKMLQKFTIPYYITNTVFCRPCNSTEGENREPSREEAKACRKNVLSLVSIVNPSVVVFVGRIAERFLKPSLSQYKQFAIFHPAHILRQGGEHSPEFVHNLRVLDDVIQYLIF